jgi:alkanesulfonate monooxygenase SsuD/methylene tetrahydromethanopterin reductase-like flavin-dependent oxidoreductase (luciferase family)
VPRVKFGYNPPAGTRQIERFDTRTFARDLQQALEIASPHFDSIWVSDHLATVEPWRMECWTQLTWIAARFPSPMLGTIVMANSYRHPPLLAKMAATLQYLSRGRLILGYGAGWHEAEYRAYGYEFPSARTRIAQMVEGIEVMKAMWSRSPATYQGRYYQVRDAYCEPRPDPLPPIMVGGDGEKYTLRAVAEHADCWNTTIKPREVLRHKLEVLAQHCRDVGRDPAGVRKSLTRTLYLAPTRSAAEARAGAALERPEGERPFIGEPAALVDHLRDLAELGFEDIQLVFANFPETNDLELFVEKVLPELGA